jgi:hypothetical protein
VQRPDFDQDRASSMIGKTLLVGLTYMGSENEVARMEQFHGEVERASADAGVVLRLSGSGREFVLPPDLSHIEAAPPGEYRLKTSGELVANPNFLCTYVIYPGSD